MLITVYSILLMIWIFYFLVYRKTYRRHNLFFEFSELIVTRNSFFILIAMSIIASFNLTVAIIVLTLIFPIISIFRHGIFYVGLKKLMNDNITDFPIAQQQILKLFFEFNFKCTYKQVTQPSRIKNHYYFFNIFEFTNKHNVNILVSIGDSTLEHAAQFGVFNTKKSYDIFKHYLNGNSKDIDFSMFYYYIISFKDKTTFITDDEFEQFGGDWYNLTPETIELLEIMRFN